MEVITVNYKEGKGRLTIDLNELFYPTPLYQLKFKNRGDRYATSDAKIERYTTAGRVKKLLTFLMANKWCNEESYNTVLSFCKAGLREWYGYAKTAQENRCSHMSGSQKYKQYTKELNECEKKFKLFHESLNLLEETKIDIKDRIKEV